MSSESAYSYTVLRRTSWRQRARVPGSGSTTAHQTKSRDPDANKRVCQTAEDGNDYKCSVLKLLYRESDTAQTTKTMPQHTNQRITYASAKLSKDQSATVRTTKQQSESTRTVCFGNTIWVTNRQGSALILFSPPAKRVVMDRSVPAHGPQGPSGPQN